MKSKALATIMILLFLASITVMAVPVRALPPAKVWVDDDFNPATSGWGVTRFAIIQDGVDAVAEGGTVYVLAGIYHGPPYRSNTVVIINNKALTLMGANPKTTIIDGTADFGHANIIGVHYAHNVRISGFTIRNGGSGIDLHGSFSITITGNILTAHEIGLVVDESHDNVITNNIISKSNSYGIHVRSSDENTIKNNVISETITYWGIGLFSSSDNNVIGNTVSKSGWFGIALQESSSGNTIACNVVSECKKVDDGTGIQVSQQSNGNTIIGNIVHNNVKGINMEASNTVISGNTIYNNDWVGICIYGLSNYNAVKFNTLFGNQEGIVIDPKHGSGVPSSNTIRYNLISKNGKGIRYPTLKENPEPGNTISTVTKYPPAYGNVILPNINTGNTEWNWWPLYWAG